MKSDQMVPNLDRALTIIEYLNQVAREVSLSEIAKALDFPQNSVYRIMMTLLARGYVERDAKTKRFMLSQKFLTISNSVSIDRNLIEIAVEFMRGLRDQTKETVLFGGLIGTEGVVLDQVPGTHHFRFMVDRGTRFPLHTAAPGKSIIALMPRKEREVFIERLEFTRFTGNTITCKEEFRQELERVREVGYGLDHGEELEGQNCIGAAIVDHYSYPVASVWITAPSNRLPESQFSEVGDLVADCCREISQSLSRSVGVVA